MNLRIDCFVRYIHCVAFMKNICNSRRLDATVSSTAFIFLSVDGILLSAITLVSCRDKCIEQY